MTTLFAFLHHLCAFTLVACIAIEFTLIRQELTLASARRLITVDGVLGMSATALLVIGLLRVYYFEKGPDYYFASGAFHAKFTLFILAALMSAVPTFEYMKWRKTVRAGQVPQVAAGKLRLMRIMIHAELAAIVLILLCAAIMARGGWI